MQDKELGFIERCAHCGKAKNMHRAYTLCCPTGKRGPTGYTTFGPLTFTPQAAREEPPHEPRRGAADDR